MHYKDKIIQEIREIVRRRKNHIGAVPAQRPAVGEPHQVLPAGGQEEAKPPPYHSWGGG